jgi:hypothetical protein
VHHLAMREAFGPAIWAWACTGMNARSLAELDRQLADPAYQLDARKKIWAEIGKEPPGPAAMPLKPNGGGTQEMVHAVEQTAA